MIFTLVAIVLGIWGMWRSPSFVNSVAPWGLEWLQASFTLGNPSLNFLDLITDFGNEIYFYCHPTPDLMMADNKTGRVLEYQKTGLILADEKMGQILSDKSFPTPDLMMADDKTVRFLGYQETGLILADKKMGQILSDEPFSWTGTAGLHSLLWIGFPTVLSLLIVLYFHQKNENKRIERVMDSVTRDLHEFEDKICELQRQKDHICELQQENEKLLQQLHTRDKTNKKLLRQLDDLEEIEQENSRLYDQLNNVSPVQAVGNFWDTDISLCSYENFHDQITVIKDLGQGVHGCTQLVEYGTESCVLKTAYNNMDKNELQIMAFLDGAGGTPRLLAATNYDFVCTLAGDMRFLDMIKDSYMGQHALIESVCQIAQQVKAIHEKGISHNDIKSDNIMFDSSTGEFNIIDFGLACHMGGSVPPMDDPNAIKRIDWMSPEYKLGEVITPASDVYSLGAMMGKVLFIFKNPNEVALALVGKAISQFPEERPTMDEFISVLDMACKYNNEYYKEQAFNAFS